MKNFNFLADFFNLLYPDLCIVCGENLLKNEQHVCLSCLHAIPKTNYHLLPNNPIEKRFWGKVPVYRATAFFFFQKGSPFQKLMHALKYKGNKEVGEKIAKYAAIDLLESADFMTVDVIFRFRYIPENIKNEVTIKANGLAVDCRSFSINLRIQAR